MRGCMFVAPAAIAAVLTILGVATCGAEEAALDRYVAAPDARCCWKRRSTIPGENYTACTDRTQIESSRQREVPMREALVGFVLSAFAMSGPSLAAGHPVSPTVPTVAPVRVGTALDHQSGAVEVGAPLQPPSAAIPSEGVAEPLPDLISWELCGDGLGDGWRSPNRPFGFRHPAAILPSGLGHPRIGVRHGIFVDIR